jgi:hypothetical protein
LITKKQATKKKKKMKQMARANYSRLLSKYQLLGKGNVRLTEGTLVLIQPITANKTIYNFPVLENEQQGGLAPLSEEIRLNINDEFIVANVGLYLYGEVRKTSEVPGDVIAKKWFTYAPYEQNSNFLHVADFYSGFMSVAVNKINYVDKWDTKKHNVIEETQFKNFAASDGDRFSTMPNVNFEDNGTIECQPNFVLSGAKKNDISISLPNAIAPATAVWLNNEGLSMDITINKIAIVYRGLLAQNASKFQG